MRWDAKNSEVSLLVAKTTKIFVNGDHEGDLLLPQRIYDLIFYHTLRTCIYSEIEIATDDVRDFYISE